MSVNSPFAVGQSPNAPLPIHLHVHPEVMNFIYDVFVPKDIQSRIPKRLLQVFKSEMYLKYTEFSNEPLPSGRDFLSDVRRTRNMTDFKQQRKQINDITEADWKQMLGMEPSQPLTHDEMVQKSQMYVGVDQMPKTRTASAITFVVFSKLVETGALLVVDIHQLLQRYDDGDRTLTHAEILTIRASFPYHVFYPRGEAYTYRRKHLLQHPLYFLHCRCLYKMFVPQKIRRRFLDHSPMEDVFAEILWNVAASINSTPTSGVMMFYQHIDKSADDRDSHAQFKTLIGMDPSRYDPIPVEKVIKAIERDFSVDQCKATMLRIGLYPKDVREVIQGYYEQYDSSRVIPIVSDLVFRLYFMIWIPEVVALIDRKYAIEQQRLPVQRSLLGIASVRRDLPERALDLIGRHLGSAYMSYRQEQVRERHAARTKMRAIAQEAAETSQKRLTTGKTLNLEPQSTSEPVVARLQAPEQSAGSSKVRRQRSSSGVKVTAKAKPKPEPKPTPKPGPRRHQNGPKYRPAARC